MITVFSYDGQKNGHDACAGSLAWVDGELWCAFTPAFEDDEAGHQPWLIRTKNLGKTWSIPEPFGPGVIQNQKRESVFLSLNGPSARGTLFANGFHFQLGAINQGRIYDDPTYRPYRVFIGRKEAGRPEFEWKWYESGKFLGEQFIERGLVLPSGRLVFTINGAKQRGENGRCGVLLSDGDGESWRYSEVAYEPDLGIRDNPAVPAGYNEQTLFRTRDGKPFTNYYMALNGQFVELGDAGWLYVFGQFDQKAKRHRILCVTVPVEE
jgi:hypothetical protein